MVSMLTVGLASCGDDDDENGGGDGGTTALTGLWKNYYYYEIEYQKNSAGQWVKTAEDEESIGNDEAAGGILFMTGGKLKAVWIYPDGTYDDTDEDYVSDYVIQNGHIYMKYAGNNEWSDAGAIKISGNTFEVSGVDYEDDCKYEWVDKYKKIG